MELITVKEAAKRTRTPLKKMYEIAHSGKYVTQLVGRRTLLIWSYDKLIRRW